METAPRNCRFLSLVVDELVLIYNVWHSNPDSDAIRIPTFARLRRKHGNEIPWQCSGRSSGELSGPFSPRKPHIGTGKRGHYERGLFTGGISRISKFSRISGKWSDFPQSGDSLESPKSVESPEDGFI